MVLEHLVLGDIGAWEPGAWEPVVWEFWCLGIPELGNIWNVFAADGYGGISRIGNLQLGDHLGIFLWGFRALDGFGGISRSGNVVPGDYGAWGFCSLGIWCLGTSELRNIWIIFCSETSCHSPGFKIAGIVYISIYIDLWQTVYDVCSKIQEM